MPVVHSFGMMEGVMGRMLVFVYMDSSRQMGSTLALISSHVAKKVMGRENFGRHYCYTTPSRFNRDFGKHRNRKETRRKGMLLIGGS